MRIIGIVFISILFQTDNSQTIKEAKLKFDLPGQEWFLADKKENENITVYIFKREPITDKNERSVIPNIAFIVESIRPKTEIVEYSLQKRLNTPFEVKKMFVHDDAGEIDFKFVNAVGYQSEYTDSNGLDHTTYFIHAINEDKGIQIIFDVTTSLFDIVDREFKRTIESIQKY